MTQTEVLQQFKQLDRSSPNFPDQLTNLLYKQEYKESIPNLQNEEVIWLVNYLDDVCLYFPCPSPCSASIGSRISSSQSFQFRVPKVPT